MADFSVFQIEITKGYDMVAFREVRDPQEWVIPKGTRKSGCRLFAFR